ncbi:YigZ family protein [Flavobacterium jejuense]|uniref:YigZ family protein n=1 Tax=Flavobacterium jejuense TaxID=1544455 RepID=A0ABX0IMR8_9FLAO|nr:YigZ family protein [Flavobacterium jejuense]NHN25102.1 YigZ family protein [Flavobacterium jejuense]
MSDFFTDTYKTIENPSDEILFKEKNSKFYGYAFPVTHEEEVKEIINQLKKQHHTARHWCYAFQIGTESIYYRANDDGEPNNSAGAPIYGQIQSFNVTNILVVIVRYFGGVKLGVGGLISAYKTAAQMTLTNSVIIEKTIDTHFQITFDYKNMNKAMRVIKEQQLTIISQKMEMNCQIEISTRKQNEEKIREIFEALFEIEIKKLDI